MSEERITLDLLFEQGQQVLDDIRTIREELREQRLRLASIERDIGCRIRSSSTCFRNPTPATHKGANRTRRPAPAAQSEI